MRLRLAKVGPDQDVYLCRDDLVGALREQAPFAVDPAVADFARQLADMLGRQGAPAPSLIRPPV